MAINANPLVQNGATINAQGTKTALNVAASSVIKAYSGRIARVSVTTAGSTSGAIYDASTLGGAVAANLVATIPNTAGVYSIDMPVFNGIVVTVGTSQVVSICYI